MTPTEAEVQELERRLWFAEQHDRLYLESSPRAENWQDRDKPPETTTDFIRAWLDEVDHHLPGARISVHTAGPSKGKYLKANPPRVEGGLKPV